VRSGANIAMFEVFTAMTEERCLLGYDAVEVGSSLPEF
jgi:hypothetical protein